jgi:hypothetical protein
LAVRHIPYPTDSLVPRGAHACFKLPVLQCVHIQACWRAQRPPGR